MQLLHQKHVDVCKKRTDSTGNNLNSIRNKASKNEEKGVFAIYMLRNFQSIEGKEVNLLGELEQGAPCTICTEHIEMQI